MDRMATVPEETGSSSRAPVIAALVLALCCAAAPAVIGIVAASGLGVVVATLGPPVALGVVIAGVAVAMWARRRSATNAARDVRQE
jgi:hypothetical protein